MVIDTSAVIVCLLNEPERAAFVEAIVTGVPVLDFTLEVARVHAEFMPLWPCAAS